MEKYKKHLIEKGFSSNTIQSYEYAIRQLKERIPLDFSNEDLLNHKDWLVNSFAPKPPTIVLQQLILILILLGMLEFD